MKNDVLKGININSKGFGTISKLAMQDRNISPVAKAIYAYLNSYAGGGDTCFPGKKKMCYDLAISKDTLNKHLKCLIEAGYVLVEQKKENGKFFHNVYTIVGEVSPRGGFSDTKNTVTEDSVTENTVSEDVATNITNININKDNINSNNIINPINQGEDMMDKIEKYREIVKHNICYETLIAPEYKNNIETVDEIVGLITEMVAVNKMPVKINGNEISADVVKSVFMKLEQGNIEHILWALSMNTNEIKNIRSYLITALYNSKTTKSNFYGAQMRYLEYGKQ